MNLKRHLKILAVHLLPTLSFLLLDHTKAYAQFDPLCFLVTEEGHLIDLTDRLCQGQSDENRVSPVNLSEESFIESLKVVSTVYLDHQGLIEGGSAVYLEEYCEARSRSLNSRQAEDLALSSLSNHLENNLLPEYIKDALIQNAQVMAVLACS